MLRLTSPLDGVVSSLAAKVGEMAQPGMPLLTIVSLTGLRVEALVPARQLTRLRVGQDARVTVDTQPGKAFGVILKEMAQVAESDGRSFRVVFRFVQPSALRPGQTARLLVHLHP
jgi:multidrug resistance efflux pump